MERVGKGGRKRGTVREYVNESGRKEEGERKSYVCDHDNRCPNRPYCIPHLIVLVKIQPSQNVLQGDAAEEDLEEEASLARLVSSRTLPHQNTSAGRGGRQMAHSSLLSRRARDM